MSPARLLFAACPAPLPVLPFYLLIARRSTPARRHHQALALQPFQAWVHFPPSWSSRVSVDAQRVRTGGGARAAATRAVGAGRRERGARCKRSRGRQCCALQMRAPRAGTWVLAGSGPGQAARSRDADAPPGQVGSTLLCFEGRACGLALGSFFFVCRGCGWVSRGANERFLQERMMSSSFISCRRSGRLATTSGTVHRSAVHLRHAAAAAEAGFVPACCTDRHQEGSSLGFMVERWRGQKASACSR